jgi:hypothetical protein
VHGNERATSRNIDGCGKFEKVLAALIPTAYENGDGKRQANPLAAFWSRLVVFQPSLPFGHQTASLRTSWAKLMMANDKDQRTKSCTNAGGMKALCFVRPIRGFCPLSPLKTGVYG